MSTYKNWPQYSSFSSFVTDLSPNDTIAFAVSADIKNRTENIIVGTKTAIMSGIEKSSSGLSVSIEEPLGHFLEELYNYNDTGVAQSIMNALNHLVHLDSGLKSAEIARDAAMLTFQDTLSSLYAVDCSTAKFAALKIWEFYQRFANVHDELCGRAETLLKPFLDKSILYAIHTYNAENISVSALDAIRKNTSSYRTWVDEVDELFSDAGFDDVELMSQTLSKLGITGNEAKTLLSRMGLVEPCVKPTQRTSKKLDDELGITKYDFPNYINDFNEINKYPMRGIARNDPKYREYLLVEDSLLPLVDTLLRKISREASGIFVECELCGKLFFSYHGSAYCSMCSKISKKSSRDAYRKRTTENQVVDDIERTCKASKQTMLEKCNQLKKSNEPAWEKMNAYRRYINRKLSEGKKSALAQINALDGNDANALLVAQKYKAEYRAEAFKITELFCKIVDDYLTAENPNQIE